MDISVVISVYNAEKHIASAIESALGQNYPSEKYEVIVVDDGSDDSTLLQIKEFSDRIRIISKKNTGLADSLNVGIKEAVGEYIIRLDGDDTLEPDILLKEIELARKEGCIVTGSYRNQISREGEASKVVKIDVSDLFNWVGAGILFKKKDLLEAGLYKKLLFEEYDILLRMASRGKIGVVRAPLYNYYLHGQNMTLKNSYWIDGVREFMKVWDAATLEKYGFFKKFDNILEKTNARQD